MIVTEFYNGQGLGNQLWCYVVTRCLALDKGFEFGIMCPERFKGAEFLQLDFGKTVVGGSGPEGGPPEQLPHNIHYYYKEQSLYYEKYKCDVSDFDPLLYDIIDNTKIDGNFQSERYIHHHKNSIREWLRLENNQERFDFSHPNICVLNIRGGEYIGNGDLLLPKKYWENAILNMLKVNQNLEFIIITDDVKYTKKLLPQYPSFHFSIGKDYSIINNAHYLILSNSSFAFFPAWLNERAKLIIAPKYWARHNISDGFWSCSFNLYSGWYWQDREGIIFSFDDCFKEFENYKNEKQFHLLKSLPPSKKIGNLRRKIYHLLSFGSKLKRSIIKQRF